ncbi:MAG TPA: OmpA family protein, partial [Pseudoxanthomonas sp.]|nr:OmpA family protein [Pseudoxanthomonas sp.]
MSRRSQRALLLVVLLAFAGAGLAAERPEVVQLKQRLVALQADPEQAELAAFEKLQAQQAIGVLAEARRRDRDSALYIAQRRVEIAETAVRAQLARREVNRLERTRSELLVEASRREAERARQEAERLRVQAQIQAEEAERLRMDAEAEALARQDVEQALTNVTGQQTARLSAARRKEAQLARQEAELMSGAKLPASKFDNRGEAFTLAADTFEAGSAKLSAAGQSRISALAAYLQAVPKAKARIEGYGDAQTPGQRRADAIRDALAAAGIGRGRIQAAGKSGGTR